MTGELNVEDSILMSIKKSLGLEPEFRDFDVDITMAVNTSLSSLQQFGVFSDRPFTITGEEQLWSQFIPEGNLDMVKSYISIKTKLLFDPPQSSFVLSSYEKQLKELEWRIYIECDPTGPDDS